MSNRVASIYFSNKTTVGIVKNLGGAKYRQLMRDAYVPKEDRPSTSRQKHSNFEKNFLGQQIISGLRSVDVQPLRDILPPWLDGRHTHLGIPLLKALKTATESYLETTITRAHIAFPFETTENFRDVFASAASSLFSSVYVMSSPAGVLAGYTYELEDTREEQIFASFEYSRAALTGHLIHLASGVGDVRRELHDIELGLDALDGALSESFKKAKLKNALAKLLQMPVDGYPGQPIKYISHIVMLGESAKNRRLDEVLKSVLHDQFRQATAANNARLLESPNPVYAASGWAAYHCWWRLDREEDCKKLPGHWCHEYPLE